MCPASPCAPTRSARLHARSEPTSWSEPIRIASSAKRTPFSTATLAPARFPRSGTVAPANGLWTSSSVNTLAFEHIRRDVEGGRNSRRGELEMGGVLFGIHEPGCIWILASKPGPMAYSHWSGFVLAKGRQLISASATAPELNGLQALGWYHSHLRSKIFLSERDRLIHSRHFWRSWPSNAGLSPSQRPSP